MKLGIGIVTSGGYGDRVPNGFFWAMWNLHSAILQGKTPVRDNVLIRSTKFPTDVARNEIVRKALDQGCDKLLFLDCDQTFRDDDPAPVIRLLTHDEAPDGTNIHIVTGRYHVKAPPYHPNLYLTPHEPHRKGLFRTVHYGQGLFPVDRCGAGCLLIHKKVLVDIGDPWFRYGVDPEPPHDVSVTEDFFFCERAQACGWTIWADWDAEMGHLVGGTVYGDWHRGYLDSMEQSIANGEDGLVDKLICCGMPNGHVLPSGHRVKPYVAPQSSLVG